jgi:hypothetical protein
MNCQPVVVCMRPRNNSCTQRRAANFGKRDTPLFRGKKSDEGQRGWVRNVLFAGFCFEQKGEKIGCLE